MLYVFVYAQIGSTAEGVINGIEAYVYDDSGWSPNDGSLGAAVNNIDNGKDFSTGRYILQPARFVHV